MTREEAIVHIKDIICENNTIKPNIVVFEQEKEALYMAIEALKQEPKTGHWEYVQYDYNPRLGNWHCSECRCVIVASVDKNDKGGIPLYKYCPNCGARMENEDKE